MKEKNKIIYILLIISIILAVILLYLSNFFSLSNSQIFYNFTVGLGAIMAGIGGLKFIFEHFSSKKTQSRIDSLKKQYPKAKINIDFNIVSSPVLTGKIYIINKKTNTKHWIKSSQTLTDLGFFWDDVTAISQEEFNRYSDGDDIWTSGKPGS